MAVVDAGRLAGLAHIRKGDSEGADKWLRIIAAIGELFEPPTDGAALVDCRDHPFSRVALRQVRKT